MDDHLRNEFNFSDIQQSMNAVGFVQRKGVKFISYIYTLYLYRFCSLIEKFWSKSCKINGEKDLLNNMFGYRVKQPSPCDINIGQSTISFICDVANM